MNQPSTPTLCAMTAIAFVIACAAHEAVGHGGACLISGGTIKVLSSSLFRCSPAHVLADGGGPLMSLITAVLAALVARLGGDGLRRTFFTLLFAIAGFWIAGELISSAVTDTDDLAFVLRSLHPHPYSLARVLMGLSGAVLYAAIIRHAARDLPTGRPLVLAYLTAGIVSCVGAMFYAADLAPAMREGALESLGASIGLIYLALRPRESKFVPASRALVPFSRTMIVVSVPVVVLFWLTLGRGFIRSA